MNNWAHEEGFTDKKGFVILQIMQYNFHSCKQGHMQQYLNFISIMVKTTSEDSYFAVSCWTYREEPPL